MTNLPKNIGGFFELELGLANFNFHVDALALTSGRSCFNFILQIIKPSKIYLPYYICDSALIPLHKNNIPFEFYSLDETLKPKKTFALQDSEYILFVNYFGLMNQALDELYQQYGNRIIIDNTHAFFAKKYRDCWSFNSARKFFGVPDGGYLYGAPDNQFEIPRNHHIGYAHLIERLLGDASAYASYLENEKIISDEILRMSLLTEKLLSNVDYAEVARKRRNNFAVYQSAFAKMNKFKFNVDVNAVPFCYPLWLDASFEHADLHKAGIFVPLFWRDLCTRNHEGYAFERQFAFQLLPLPTDHRYSTEDCSRVVDVILKWV